MIAFSSFSFLVRYAEVEQKERGREERRCLLGLL